MSGWEVDGLRCGQVGWSRSRYRREEDDEMEMKVDEGRLTIEGSQGV
jgi:hypothetical protein